MFKIVYTSQKNGLNVHSPLILFQELLLHNKSNDQTWL